MIAERFALTDLKAMRAEGEAKKVWVVLDARGRWLLSFYDAILTVLQAP